MFAEISYKRYRTAQVSRDKTFAMLSQLVDAKKRVSAFFAQLAIGIVLVAEKSSVVVDEKGNEVVNDSKSRVFIFKPILIQHRSAVQIEVIKTLINKVDGLIYVLVVSKIFLAVVSVAY